MVKRTCCCAESEGTLLPAAAVLGIPHPAWPLQAAEIVTTQTEAVPRDSVSYTATLSTYLTCLPMVSLPQATP